MALAKNSSTRISPVMPCQFRAKSRSFSRRSRAAVARTAAISASWSRPAPGAGAAGCASERLTNPRIQPGDHQVAEKRDDDVKRGRQQDRALDDRVVARADRVDNQRTDAGAREDDLGE